MLVSALCSCRVGCDTDCELCVQSSQLLGWGLKWGVDWTGRPAGHQAPFWALGLQPQAGDCRTEWGGGWLCTERVTDTGTEPCGRVKTRGPREGQRRARGAGRRPVVRQWNDGQAQGIRLEGRRVETRGLTLLRDRVASGCTLPRGEPERTALATRVKPIA